MSRAAFVITAALLALLVAALPAAAAPRKKRPTTREVLYVGNNWDGTADVIQPRRFKRLARINIIPDIDERMKEIQSNPERYGVAAHGTKPYWATNSGRGSYCFVSFSGDDAVSVISYRKATEIARIPVGDHPQRMRMGKVRAGWLGTKPYPKPKRRRR